MKQIIKSKYYDIIDLTKQILLLINQNNYTIKNFEIIDSVFFKGGIPETYFFNEYNKICVTTKDIDIDSIVSKLIKDNSKLSKVCGVIFKEESSKFLSKDKNNSSNKRSKDYFIICNLNCNKSTKYFCRIFIN